MTVSPFRHHAVVVVFVILTFVSGGTASAQKNAPVPTTERNAEIAMERGNAASAVAIYTKLIQKTPRKFKLYLGRGIAYFQIQQYDKAALDFSSFIKLRPKLVEGYLNRAYAYERAGRYKEGLADLEMVECLDPTRRVDSKLRERLLAAIPE